MKTVKKNPLVMITSLIITDSSLLVLYYIGASIFRYFGSRELDFLAANKVLTFNLITLSIVFGLQILIFVYVFLSWYFESYQITKNAFIHRKGIVMRQRRILPLRKIELIEFKQSPIGKLFKFGAIILKNHLNSDGIKFGYFPEPEKNVGYIRQQRKEIPKKQKSEKENNKEFEIKNNVGVDELLAKKREDREVEFKASLRWDKKLNKVNKSLEKAVMKTLAGFMNAKGGYLLIGVNDDGKISGLEKDFQSLPKKTIDGFENHFNQVFKEMLGVENRQFVTLTFHKKKNRNICLVTVIPSYNPVYLDYHDKEDFYVRTGNTTSPLSLRQVASYIKNNWR